MGTRKGSVGETTRGLTALAALIVLSVGVPAALSSAAGSPLSASMPGWSSILATLRGSEISDATIIHGAAVICWAAWAVLMVCVLVEAVAWIRGRTAVRLPLVGGLQPSIGRLVASALLVFSSFAGATRPAVASTAVGHARTARVVSAPAPGSEGRQSG